MSVRGIIRSLALSVVLLAAAGSAAFAQQREPVAATMGYPGLIGIQVPLNDQWAFRPEISFGGGSNDSSSAHNLALSLGALYYFRGDDVVRTYVIPRIGFGWSSLSPDEDSDLSGDVSNSQTMLSGSIGAEYRAHPRFGVFAELGLEFTHSTTEIKVLDNKASSNQWGTRTAIGAIVRF